MDDQTAVLYDALMKLTNSNEAFYFQDFQVDGQKFRVFNYRLASYTDFMQPYAMESRGIMFEINDAGDMLSVASRPMHKFFNLNENPYTIDLDLSKVRAVYDKLDGSLISSYMTKDLRLRLKTKGSLTSEQAIKAMEWLDNDCYAERVALRQTMEAYAFAGYTVNCEWTAPDNRIVVGYLKPALRVLNVRSNDDGSYMDYEDLLQVFGTDAVVERYEVHDPVQFIADIKDETGVEGVVCVMDDGKWFKVKCDWYVSLHHAKDSVNNPRRLFESILDEGIDDLRSMFVGDELAMRTIDQMQEKVNHLYNMMVNQVEFFYESSKHLDRKSYALLGQQVFEGTSYFSLAMSKYLDRPVDYKQFLKSRWKELGLKDTVLDKEQ